VSERIARFAQHQQPKRRRQIERTQRQRHFAMVLCLPLQHYTG
jgi:hypothetical protein